MSKKNKQTFKRAAVFLTAFTMAAGIMTALPQEYFPQWGITVSAEEGTIVDSGTCGENVTYILDSDGLLTISGTGAMDDYYNTFDEEEDNRRTTAPWGNKLVTSVKIKNSVTSIGDSAFQNCSNLTNITIPNSVTSIGEYAFNNCSGLTSITLSNSITSIDEGTFSQCSSLTTIIIPDGVTSIGRLAFNGCSGLTSITLPDSVTSIMSSAFFYCSSLTSITFPDDVAYVFISDNAFCGCSSLISIRIPASDVFIGNNAFFNCNKLTIYGVKKSNSYTYALSNNIPFVDINNMSVTNPKITKLTAGNGQVTVNWSALNGATNYKVCYKISGTKSWSSVNVSGSTTSYTVTGLKNGTTYEFVVKAAINSAWTTATGKDVVAATPLAAAVNPQITGITAGNGQATVNWGAVNGATSYKVCYKVSGAKTWSSVNVSASKTNYTVTGLKSGTKYEFVVKAAVNGAWTTATGKDVVSATPMAAAVNPKITKLTADNGKVNVKWNTVDGAKWYRVYYKVSGTKNWISPVRVDSKTTSYTVTGLKNGTTYEFVVKAAINDAWTTATGKDVVKITPYNPVNPTITKATAGNQKVTLNWNKVAGSKWYRVYYKVSGTKNWISPVRVDANTTSYTVTGLKNGVQYEFVVKAAVNDKWTTATGKNVVKSTPSNTKNDELEAGVIEFPDITLPDTDIPVLEFIG